MRAAWFAGCVRDSGDESNDNGAMARGMRVMVMGSACFFAEMKCGESFEILFYFFE